MITPYVRPQTKIFQTLRDTAGNAVNRFGSLAIGTQYLLALNDGRELPESVFDSAGASLAYRYIKDGLKTVDPVTHVVKQDSARLYGRELEANIATGILTIAVGASGVTHLRDSVAFAGLGGRKVRIGDVAVVSTDYVTAGSYAAADDVFTRKVIGLLPAKVASVVGGAPIAAITNAPANVTASAVVTNVVFAVAYSVSGGDVPTVPTGVGTGIQKFTEIGGRFNGKLGEEITFTCIGGPSAGVAPATQGVATFSVAYTTLGTNEVITTTASSSKYSAILPALGGTTVLLTHAGLATIGDIFRVIVYPVTIGSSEVILTVNAASRVLYTGTNNTSYVIEVVKGGDNNAGVFPAGTQIRIYDTDGKEPVQYVGVTSATSGISLGTKGLKLDIAPATGAAPDLVTGDRFVIPVIAPTVSTTVVDGIVLDGPALNPARVDASTKLSVDIRESFTGELKAVHASDGTPFSTTASAVVYDASLRLLIAKSSPTFAPFVNGRGKIVLSYKAALKPALLEGAQKVASRSAIADGQFGELNVENDLAFGVYQMFSGAGEQPIHALRTAGPAAADFTDALRKVRGVDIHYALAPLTDDLEAIRRVVVHCEEMSDPEHMNFRRCYFGTNSPGEYEAWGAFSDGSYRKATLIGDIVTLDDEFYPASSFLKAYVGDKVQFLSLADPLIITEILSAKTVRVSGPATSGLGLATSVSFKLIKPDTADNIVDYVAARSVSINSRRAVNVWSDRPTAMINGINTVVPSKFIACEVAGLRSALKPQQGLTMTEITSVTDAPAMFARFTPEQLDTAAAAGVMVVTQEIEGGEIFIRHQLTTRTGNGALQWEDNPGVVTDAFSYRIKDKFRGYIGKKNVTPATISEIETDLKQLSIEASQEEAIFSDAIGPLIIRFANEAGVEGQVTVEVDGDLADKIRTFVRITVALPLNGLNNYVEAVASVII